MAPLYDFECPHGHRFERICSMAERNEEVPCEGTVNQMVSDEIADEAMKLHGQWLEDPSKILIVNDVKVTFVTVGEGTEATPFAVSPVPCKLSAKLLVGPHSNPKCMLDHGMAANRDAAREGRYDPLNPNQRFIAKGRTWRK